MKNFLSVRKLTAITIKSVICLLLSLGLCACFGSSKSSSENAFTEKKTDPKAEAASAGAEKPEQHYLVLRVDKMPFSFSSACDYQSKKVDKKIKNLNFAGEIVDGVQIKFSIDGKDVIEEPVSTIFRRYEELGGESVREEVALSEWSGTINNVKAEVKATSARFQRDGDCIYRLTYAITAENITEQ
jgi:hypothetical protein